MQRTNILNTRADTNTTTDTRRRVTCFDDIPEIKLHAEDQNFCRREKKKRQKIIVSEPTRQVEMTLIVKDAMSHMSNSEWEMLSNQTIGSKLTELVPELVGSL